MAHSADIEQQLATISLLFKGLRKCLANDDIPVEVYIIAVTSELAVLISSTSLAWGVKSSLVDHTIASLRDLVSAAADACYTEVPLDDETMCRIDSDVQRIIAGAVSK